MVINSKTIDEIRSEIKLALNGLPFGLTPLNVSKLLGINITAAYQLFHRQGFPRLIIGRRMICPATAFLKWVEEEAYRNAA